MTAGIILAAGVSSRMGSFKPLLPIGNSVFIRRLISQMRAAGVEDIVVITGYRREELEAEVKNEKVICIHNDRYYETQMLDSVRLGIAHFFSKGQKYERVLLSPVDVVMSPAWVFEEVLIGDADFVRPIYKGQPGHPVLIRNTLFEDILSYRGENGLRGAVEASGKKILDLDVEDPNILLDADTREDYRKAIAEYDLAMGEKGRLHGDMELKLVSGEPVCGEGFMQILELVASTGSLQNAARAMKMSYTKAWKIVKFVESKSEEKLIEREAGGENGGRSRLTAHGEELLFRYKKMRLELDASVREIFDRNFDGFRL